MVFSSWKCMRDPSDSKNESEAFLNASIRSCRSADSSNRAANIARTRSGSDRENRSIMNRGKLPAEASKLPVFSSDLLSIAGKSSASSSQLS